MVKAASVSVASALAELRSKSKTPIRIGTLSSFMSAPKVMETGNIVLDSITGIGGIPRGRITEFSGPTGSGKTTSALQSAGLHQQAVKAGTDTGAVMYLDFERTLDMRYCRSLGIDPDDEETFIYMQPDSFEHGIDIFRNLMEKGLLGLCIVDSVASMVSQKELEGDSTLITVGAKAKALNLACRQLIPGLSNTETGIIFLNHEQVKIDTTWAGKQKASRGIIEYVNPGGTAIPYYSSLRVRFGPASGNKTEEVNEIGAAEKRVTSTDVVATVIKNKLSVPFRTGSMRVRFGKGFSQPYSVYEILTERNIIKKKTGGYYEFPEGLLPSDGKPVGQISEENLIGKIESDPAWLARLLVEAKKVVQAYNEELLKAYNTTDYPDDDDNYTVDEETGEMIAK
jgi:recombination protein RecA